MKQTKMISTRSSFLIRLALVLLWALSVFALVSCQKNKRHENEGQSGAVEAPADHEHIYGEWVTTKEPSCRMAGLKERVCTVEGCGKKESEGLPVLDHDLVHHNAQAVSCTDIGWDAYDTCSRCPYTTYQEKAALGHNIVHHEAQAVSCTKVGWDAYDTCSRCNYTTYQEIAALGHNIVHHEAQAVSCTKVGWNAYDACSRCDYTTYREIAALGHEYEDHYCVRCSQIDPTYYTDGLVFSSLGDTYSVTGYNGTAANVIIPAIYQNKAVTEIKDGAFKDSGITSIIIPESVTRIGSHVFEDCDSLTSITVAENNPQYHSAGNCVIKTIYKTLIAGCNNSVIPDDGSVTEIGSCAFKNCGGLTSIIIPGSVTKIDYEAFKGCSGLTSVSIPGSVTKIDHEAFMGCGLTSVSIPGSVITIGLSAFSDCDNLNSISISEGVTTINTGAFSGCNNLTSIVIPKSVAKIELSAFNESHRLSHVYYCGNASEWDGISIDSTNEELTGATRYYYSATQPVWMDDRWHFVEDVPTVWQSYYTEGLHFSLFGNTYSVTGYDGSATEVIIPTMYQNKTVTMIEDSAFKNSSVTLIVIPKSVITISFRAFDGCSGLTNIYYGGNASDWGGISIGESNEKLIGATRYYYSETAPTASGNWWHFVNGVPTVWPAQ